MGGSRAPSDRASYLRDLLKEFRSEAPSPDAKRQVLANLSNFAYDPYNYKHIRDIGILDEFVKQIQNEHDPVLVHFACSGICNLSPDPVNAQYILRRNCIQLLENLLSSKHEETQLNAITALIYLSEFDVSIRSNNNIKKLIQSFEQSHNQRFKNLAIIFSELNNKIDTLSNKQNDNQVCVE